MESTLGMFGLQIRQARLAQVGPDIDGEATGDYFCKSVALCVAIGATLNDANGADSGHVRIFRRKGESWIHVGRVIDGEAARDQSGDSVAMSADGTTVAIGAIFNDGHGNNSGHVRVYQLNDGAWTQLGSDIDGEAIDDRSGTLSLCLLDGTILAIRAYWNDGNSANSGHVRVYCFDSGAWKQVGSDIDGARSIDNGELFGSSIAI